jgi:hypothetical protein
MSHRCQEWWEGYDATAVLDWIPVARLVLADRYDLPIRLSRAQALDWLYKWTAPPKDGLEKDGSAFRRRPRVRSTWRRREQKYKALPSPDRRGWYGETAVHVASNRLDRAGLLVWSEHDNDWVMTEPPVEAIRHEVHDMLVDLADDLEEAARALEMVDSLVRRVPIADWPAESPEDVLGPRTFGELRAADPGFPRVGADGEYQLYDLLQYGFSLDWHPRDRTLTAG